MGYRRWDEGYWQSACRERIGADHVSAAVWHWLVCSAHGNSLGVYRVPWRVAWIELWLGSEAEGRAAVARCVDLVGPTSARLDGDWVWIVGASQRQHDALSPRDNRLRSRQLRDEIETVRHSPYWAEWWRLNDVHFRLADLGYGPTPKGSHDPFEAPSKGSHGPSGGVAPPIPSHPIPSHPIPSQGASARRVKDGSLTGLMLAMADRARSGAGEVLAVEPVWVTHRDDAGLLVLDGMAHAKRRVLSLLAGHVRDGE